MTQKVSALSWIDLDLRCSIALLGQWPINQGNSLNPYQPNPGPRPSGSPCNDCKIWLTKKIYLVAAEGHLQINAVPAREAVVRAPRCERDGGLVQCL